MAQRINYLDYLKCVLIILMVIFHLVYIGDKYPYIKQVVYTFHMPAFLVISGFLVNICKPCRKFFTSVFWIFFPYAIMEIGYVIMSSILPVRESVDNLSLLLVIEKVFIHPIGPYWYLHTLVVSYIVCYLVYKITSVSEVSRLIIMILFFILLSYINIVSIANTIYFMLGFVIRRHGKSFDSFFSPSCFSIVLFIVLCFRQENLDKFTIAGMVITCLSISSLLWLYRYIPERTKSFSYYIGRNTISILLFSPIFTILSKSLVPIFSFDHTGICFAIIAVAFTIGGSIFVAYCMDFLRLSTYFCGKDNLIS